MQIYLVGGAVRDALLNLPVKERDWVVVDATPDDLLSQGFSPVGKDFPVFLHPVTHEEYALARTERKIEKGYHGFQFHTSKDVSLLEDLQRRDLTINAMAQDSKGLLIDPYGGQNDLQKKQLRHVSPAFVEDPVRILRVARFAARYNYLGFTIAPETMQLMQTMVQNKEADALVPERVWQEIVRSLGEHSPDVFFTVLKTCGALKVLLPELDALFGTPCVNESGDTIDAGELTLFRLRNATAFGFSNEIRFATLWWNTGSKKPSPSSQTSSSMTFLSKRLRIPNDFSKLAFLSAMYYSEAFQFSNLSPERKLNLLQKLDAFRNLSRFDAFCKTLQTDSFFIPENQKEKEIQALRNAHQLCLAIPIAPFLQEGLSGKDIGEALKQKRLSILAHS